MLRGLASPRWILIHIGIGSLTAFMMFLGFWQLNRLEVKRQLNDSIITRTAERVMPMADVLTKNANPQDLEWRRVSLTGTYKTEEAITVINRSQNNTAGYNVVVPLYTNDGVVIINRGFVPLAITSPPSPTTPVTIVGFLRLSQQRSALGAIDSSDPEANEFQRFDIPRIAAGINADVAPMFVQVIEENPTTAGPWPSVVGLPALGEGSHLSYAFQWAFFSLVSLTGWIVVIRRKWLAGSNDPFVQAPTSA
jgi:cytochrome oxidase assembly protein ShyY1